MQGETQIKRGVASFTLLFPNAARSEEGNAVLGGGSSRAILLSLRFIGSNSMQPPQKPQGSPWSCGRGELAQPHHAHEGFLDVQQFALTFVFFQGAVGESFFQENQVATEFELSENQAA